MRIRQFGLIAILFGWQAVFASTPEDIKTLVEKGDMNAAYELGIKNSAEESGDPVFDYYFGLAAIESGHPEQAIFALERVVMQDPENHRARLELARAQYILGDYHTSEKNFEIVLENEPPPNVEARIRLFLTKIDERLSVSRRILSGYAEATVGYDSNINSATSENTVTTPALGQVTLDETSKEIDDTFTKLTAGVDYKYALNKITGLFASASILAQNNFSSDTFDTQVVGARVGIAHAKEKNRFEVPVQFQQLWVDGDSFRKMATIGAEWGRTLSGNDRSSLFAQYGSLTFPDQETRDASLMLAGGSWTHQVSKEWLLASSVYYGNEEADEVLGKHNGRDYYGLRLGNQWVMTPQHTLYSVIGAQHVKHADDHPVFAETRVDDFYQVSIGWAWQFSKSLVLKTDLEYYDNQSNISLFEYTRSVLQATLRYGF